MYSQIYLCVRCNNKLTPFSPSNFDVQQGDSLSPTLFTTFINDLPSVLQSTTDNVILEDIKLNCLLYADDLVLLSTSKEGLQNH